MIRLDFVWDPQLPPLAPSRETLMRCVGYPLGRMGFLVSSLVLNGPLASASGALTLDASAQWQSSVGSLGSRALATSVVAWSNVHRVSVVELDWIHPRPPQERPHGNRLSADSDLFASSGGALPTPRRRVGYPRGCNGLVASAGGVLTTPRRRGGYPLGYDVRLAAADGAFATRRRIGYPSGRDGPVYRSLFSGP